MPKLRMVELSDIMGDLPDVRTFTPISDPGKRVDDLFLCALGFEERCLTLPRLLRTGGYRSRRAVYFEYATNTGDNDKNQPELLADLRAISSGVTPLEVDIPNLGNRLRDLVEPIAVPSSKGPSRITIDISAVANRLLVMCLKVLLEYDVNLVILYSEAATYHPTKEEYEKDPEKWRDDAVLGMEIGVSDIYTSPEFAGYHLDPLPDAVILFPTFKAERSKAVISAVEPSLLTNPGGKLIWVLGLPHLEENSWRLEALRDINRLAPPMQQYSVSTFDYRDTLPVLESVYRKISDTHKLTLSPLGSKMQALGVALFCYLRPDTRVMFAVPKEYNARQWSGGCRATWRIDFGSLSELRALLDRVGTLWIED